MTQVWMFGADDGLRQAVAGHLSRCGMEVSAQPYADVPQVEMQPGDVMVCDVDVAGENGFSMAARLRAMSGAGLILLGSSARREDRFLGLSLGADHYLVKPVDPYELELLVRNLQRRLARQTAARMPQIKEPKPGSWCFSTAFWQLRTPGGQVISLSMAEHVVLRLLLENAGEVVSRDALTRALTGRNVQVLSRNLDMIVSRLRRKIETACGEKLPVQSARSVGYVFAGKCQVTQSSPPQEWPSAEVMSERQRRA